MHINTHTYIHSNIHAPTHSRKNTRTHATSSQSTACGSHSNGIRKATAEHAIHPTHKKMDKSPCPRAERRRSLQEDSDVAYGRKQCRQMLPEEGAALQRKGKLNITKQFRALVSKEAAKISSIHGPSIRIGYQNSKHREKQQDTAVRDRFAKQCPTSFAASSLNSCSHCSSWQSVNHVSSAPLSPSPGACNFFRSICNRYAQGRQTVSAE